MGRGHGTDAISQCPADCTLHLLPTYHGTRLSLQVYADRYMRLWDVHTGALVTEVFTGHRIGETVLGLAVDSSDQRIATADSAGFVKVCGAGRVRGKEGRGGCLAAAL